MTTEAKKRKRLSEHGAKKRGASGTAKETREMNFHTPNPRVPELLIPDPSDEVLPQAKAAAPKGHEYVMKSGKLKPGGSKLGGLESGEMNSEAAGSQSIDKSNETSSQLGFAAPKTKKGALKSRTPRAKAKSKTTDSSRKNSSQPSVPTVQLTNLMVTANGKAVQNWLEDEDDGPIIIQCHNQNPGMNPTSKKARDKLNMPELLARLPWIYKDDRQKSTEFETREVLVVGAVHVHAIIYGNNEIDGLLPVKTGRKSSSALPIGAFEPEDLILCDSDNDLKNWYLVGMVRSKSLNGHYYGIMGVDRVTNYSHIGTIGFDLIFFLPRYRVSNSNAKNNIDNWGELVKKDALIETEDNGNQYDPLQASRMPPERAPNDATDRALHLLCQASFLLNDIKKEALDKMNQHIEGHMAVYGADLSNYACVDSFITPSSDPDLFSEEDATGMRRLISTLGLDCPHLTEENLMVLRKSIANQSERVSFVVLEPFLKQLDSEMESLKHEEMTWKIDSKAANRMVFCAIHFSNRHVTNMRVQMTPSGDLSTKLLKSIHKLMNMIIEDMEASVVRDFEDVPIGGMPRYSNPEQLLTLYRARGEHAEDVDTTKAVIRKMCITTLEDVQTTYQNHFLPIFVQLRDAVEDYLTSPETENNSENGEVSAIEEDLTAPETVDSYEESEVDTLEEEWNGLYSS